MAAPAESFGMEATERTQLVNLVETEVFSSADRLTAADPAFCGCTKCLIDVAALALSSIPPVYATSEEGRELAQGRIEAEGVKAQITDEVMKAIAAVRQQPRH